MQGTRPEVTLGAGRALSPPEDARDVPAPGHARGPPLGRGRSAPELPWALRFRCCPDETSARPTPPSARGTDPRLWLPCESGSPSTSSTLATFFSLLLFFCAGGSGVRACGARPDQARPPGRGEQGGCHSGVPASTLPGLACPAFAAPCLAGALGDLSSGHWPVWVRGGPLRHLLHPAPTGLQPQPLLPDDTAGNAQEGAGRWARGPGGRRGPPTLAGTGTAVGAGGPAGPCAWRNCSWGAGCSVCWFLRPPRTPRPPRPRGREGQRGQDEPSVRPGRVGAGRWPSWKRRS